MSVWHSGSHIRSRAGFAFSSDEAKDKCSDKKHTDNSTDLNGETME